MSTGQNQNTQYQVIIYLTHRVYMCFFGSASGNLWLQGSCANKQKTSAKFLGVFTPLTANP